MEQHLVPCFLVAGVILMLIGTPITPFLPGLGIASFVTGLVLVLGTVVYMIS